MASLTVRVDPVAVLREARGLKEPDPAQVVVLSEMAGAEGIGMLLRRDRKYTRERDMYMLKELVKTRLSLDMPPVDTMLDRVLEVKPWMVTFVADHADSDSPVSGIDFSNTPVDFSEIVGRIRGAGMNACFQVEPEMDSVKGAARAGADAVMIDCRDFAEARTMDQAQESLDRIDRAAGVAVKNNMRVRAGGGLNYLNVQSLVELGLIEEFVIGHAIAARALLTGYQQAVSDMVRLVKSSSGSGS